MAPSRAEEKQADGPVSMRRLMALENLGNDTYRSITPAWAPGNGTTAFGGHVYAQAAYAASKTVSRGMTIHNITGHFVLPGRIDTPFTYRVRRIRDGGSYCLRSVDVYQHTSPDMKLPRRMAHFKDKPDTNTPCFVATMSFKRSEREAERLKTVAIKHQSLPAFHLRETYQSVLAGILPESHPVAPGADALWFTGTNRAEWGTTGDLFPGVDVRKVDMGAYNGVVGEGGSGRASQWRQLSFYRLVLDNEHTDEYRAGRMSEKKDRNGADKDDEVHLHIAAHLYASDRNSLFLIQHALGYQDRWVAMASLSYTVVFHGGVRGLNMVDDRGRPKWFVQEAWTSNSGENRGCHESRLWDWEGGQVVATTLQDGMMRIWRHEDVVGAEDGYKPRRGKAQRADMDADTKSRL